MRPGVPGHRTLCVARLAPIFAQLRGPQALSLR